MQLCTSRISSLTQLVTSKCIAKLAKFDAILSEFCEIYPSKSATFKPLYIISLSRRFRFAFEISLPMQASFVKASKPLAQILCLKQDVCTRENVF